MFVEKKRKILKKKAAPRWIHTSVVFLGMALRFSLIQKALVWKPVRAFIYLHAHAPKRHPTC